MSLRLARTSQVGILEHIGCKSTGNGIDVLRATFMSHATFAARLPIFVHSLPRILYTVSLYLSFFHWFYFLSLLIVFSPYAIRVSENTYERTLP